MSDTLPTGEEPVEEVEDADELVGKLDLGIELSPEEQAEAEEMVARLKEQFGLEDPVVEEEPVEEAEVEEEAEPVVATTSPSERGMVVVDGVEVPVQEAVGYLAKREAQREIEAARAAAPPEQPKAPEPPKPPEWLDTDDPAQMAMWERQVAVERQVSQIAGNQQQIAQAQAVTRAQADAESGINTFRTLHPELSENDITTLRTHAVSLDIIDGLARTRSGPDAIVKALDIAYWDHPDFQLGEWPNPHRPRRRKPKPLSARASSTPSGDQVDQRRGPKRSLT